MIARYSFAVCKRCGVQSPPVLWSKGDLKSQIPEFVQALEAMDWHFDILAVCPACRNDQEKDPKTAA